MWGDMFLAVGRDVVGVGRDDVSCGEMIADIIIHTPLELRENDYICSISNFDTICISRLA